MGLKKLSEEYLFPNEFDIVMKIGGDCAVQQFMTHMNIKCYRQTPFLNNISFNLIKNVFLLITKGIVALDMKNLEIIYHKKWDKYYVHDKVTDNFYRHSPILPHNLKDINKVQQELTNAKKILKELCEQTHDILNQENKNILLIFAGFQSIDDNLPIDCSYNLKEAKTVSCLLNSHFKSNITLLYLNTGEENKIDFVDKHLIAIQHTLPNKCCIQERGSMLAAMFGHQLNKITQNNLIKNIVNKETKLIACHHPDWVDVLVLQQDTNKNYRRLRPDHTFDVLEHTKDTLKVKWHKFGIETFKARKPDTFPIYWLQ